MRPVKFRTIGVIVAVHGLDGSLVLKPADPEMPWLETLESVYLVLPQGVKETPVISAETYGVGLRMQLEGVLDRTAADKLKGVTVQLPDSMLPELEPDEFYTDDLVGLSVVSDTTGKALGVIADVVSASAGDYLEIKTPASSEPVLVPFLSVFVKTVDTTARLVTLQGLDSLFDADETTEAPTEA